MKLIFCLTFFCLPLATALAESSFQGKEFGELKIHETKSATKDTFVAAVKDGRLGSGTISIETLATAKECLKQVNKLRDESGSVGEELPIEGGFARLNGKIAFAVMGVGQDLCVLTGVFEGDRIFTHLDEIRKTVENARKDPPELEATSIDSSSQKPSSIGPYQATKLPDYFKHAFANLPLARAVLVENENRAWFRYGEKPQVTSVNLWFTQSLEEARQRLAKLRNTASVGATPTKNLPGDAGSLIKSTQGSASLIFRRGNVVCSIYGSRTEDEPLIEMGRRLDSAFAVRGHSSVWKDLLSAFPAAAESESGAASPLTAVADVDELVDGLADRKLNDKARCQLLLQLGNHSTDQSMAILKKYANDDQIHDHVRSQAVRAIARTGHEDAPEALTTVMAATDPALVGTPRSSPWKYTRVEAITGLVALKHKGLSGILDAVIKNPDEDARVVLAAKSYKARQ